MVKKSKRWLSIMLTVMMLASFVPAISYGADGAGSEAVEGTSAETLDKLRIPSDEVPVEDDNNNPYGNGTFNMYPRKELFMQNYISNQLKIFDYDVSKSGKIHSGENIIDDPSSLTKYQDGTFSSASTACDLDGTGREEYVARVVINCYDNSSFFLALENKEGTEIKRVEFGKLGFICELFGWQMRSHLQITSGDYNGDGYDEIAVYNPVAKSIQVYSGKKLNLICETGIAYFATQISYDYKTFEGMPIVHMTSGNLEDDNSDRFITTVSGAGYFGSKYGINITIPFTTVSKLTDNKIDNLYSIAHQWDYTKYNPADTSGQTQISAYGSTAVGDINGDDKEELILAGYDYNVDDLNSLDIGLNKESANIAVIQYNSETKTYEEAYGGVAQSVKVHGAVKDGTWSGTQAPMSVACFNAFGTGTADAIFVQGQIYTFEEGSEDAKYSGVATSNDHIARQYGYKDIYYLRGIFPRAEKCWYGDKSDDSDNIWIESMVVGNFNNDPNGCEGMVVAVGRKRDDHNEYRHDTIAMYSTGADTLTDDRICQDNNRSSARQENLDLSAPDIDNDGALMKFKSKSAYFSDPHVVAVLQAAPYFADLESMNSDYIEDGATVFGKTSGSGTTDTNGFEFSASVITGFKSEASFLGIRNLGAGADYEVDIHASMGGEWENESEKTYSTEFESDSRDDRVVLSMTPYIRYVYEMYIPEFKIPTYAEYQAECAKLSGAALESYKSDVAIALGKNYTYGETVPGYPTEFIVCMPKTPRMSMVEVSVYDKVARENGYELVRPDKSEGTGILGETIGDPRTYPSAPTTQMKFFDGGRDLVGEGQGLATDGFIYVSKGGGTVTQGIEVSQSKTKSITWGAGITSTNVNDAAGVKAGFSIGADYTGSHGWSNYSSTVCSGTVAGIPNESVDLGYDFKWKFGQWVASLNGENCIVLGYLTRDTVSPPSLPQNISIKDVTDSTITLNWNHPTNRGTAYDLYLVTDNVYNPYYKLTSVSSSLNEYVVENLNPNTNYTFVMTSSSSTMRSAYSNEVTGKTKYSDTDNVLRFSDPDDVSVIAGASAMFSVNATSAVGGGSIYYQWQKREVEDNSSSWQDIPTQTGNKLVLYSVSDEDDGSEYRCRGSQLVSGEVVDVYSNPALLSVGKGNTKTTISLSSDKGSAAGTYTTATTEKYTDNINLSTTVDGKNYNVLTYGTGKYILQLNDAAGIESGGVLKYLIHDSTDIEKIENAVSENSQTVELGNTMKAMTDVFEYVMADGTSTGISIEEAKTEESGTITVDEVDYNYTKVIDKGDLGKIFVVENTDAENNFFFSNNLSDPTPTYESVAVELTGYHTEINDFATQVFSPVTVKVTRESVVYKTNSTTGEYVTLSASIQSLSQGINVIPTGVVEFEMAYNNDTSQVTRKSVTLGSSNVSNTNTVSVNWMPEKEGTYTITARYKGDSKLLYSLSNVGSYEAYVVNPQESNQVKQYLMLGGSNEITYGDNVDLAPYVKNVIINNSGETIKDVNITEESAKTINYSVSLKDGSSADGMYKIENNKFIPLTSGTFAISAYESEKSISAMKTIYVGKKKLTIAPIEISTGKNQIQEGLDKVVFSKDSVKLTDRDNPEDDFSFVDLDSYEFNNIAFFTLSTDATVASDVGDYTISVSEEKSTAVVSDDDWVKAKSEFLGKYDVLYETAVFSIIGESYKLTYSAGSNGNINALASNGVTVGNNTNVIKDSSIRFDAIGNSGYSVDYWLVNGVKYESQGAVVNDSTITLTMDQPLDIKVFFKADSYTISYSAAKNGSISAAFLNNGQEQASPITVFPNNSIQFSATPNAGYTVKEWHVTRGSKTTVVKNSDDSVYAKRFYVLANINADYTVEVVFVEENFYNITASVIDNDGNSSTAGMITISGGVTNEFGQYQNGSAVTLTATSSDVNTAQIKEWRLYADDTNYTVIQGNTPEYVINNLQKDYDIRVVFDSLSQNTISFGAVDVNNAPLLNAAISAKSNGTALESGKSYQTNIPIDFEVAIPAGYEMIGWKTDDTILNEGLNTFNLMMLDKDMTVTAVLRKMPVITIPAGVNGNVHVYLNDVQITTGTPVSYNSNVVVKLAPNNGYVVYKAMGSVINGLKQNGEMEYTISNIIQDTQISTEFVKKPVVTIMPETNSTGSVMGTVDGVEKTITNGDYVDFGSEIAIDVTPSAGYVVDTICQAAVNTGKLNGEKSYAVTNISGNQSVTYTTVAKPVVKISDDENANITAVSTVDGVSSNVANGSYVDFGADLSFTVTPIKGYWVGENMGGVALTYADQTGKTTDARHGLISSIFADTQIMPNIYLLNSYLVNYSAVDIGEGVTNGKVSADVSRKDMALYETDEDKLEPAVNGTATVYDGGSLKLMAIADSGYRVKEWIIDGVVYTNNGETFVDGLLPVVPTANMDISVQFEKGDSMVTFDQPENGVLTAVSGGADFTTGGKTKTNVEFTVTPDENYELLGWYLDNSLIEDAKALTYTYETIAEVNAHISVKLKGKPLNISVTAGAGGTVEPIADTILYGDSLSLSATPNVGYVFDGWYLNGTKLEDSTATYDAGIQNGDATYEARFNVSGFNVTFGVNDEAMGTIGATVNGNEFTGEGQVTGGSKLTLKVTLEDGYYVAQWLGAKDAVFSADNTVAEISQVGSELNITAVLAEKPKYNITVIQPLHGIITAQMNGEDVTEALLGDKVVFTLTPDKYYMFKNWTDDGASEESTSFERTITGDITVGAQLIDAVNYKFKYWAIGDGAVNALSDAGNITIDKEIDLVGGSKISLTATPASGQMVKEWKVNGVKQSVYENLLPIELYEKTDVTVEFEPIVLYDLPVGVQNEYSVSIDSVTAVLGESTGKVRKNGTFTFTVTPVEGKSIKELNLLGYDCINATGDVSGATEVTSVRNSDGSYSVTVSEVAEQPIYNIKTDSGAKLTIETPTNGSVIVKLGDTILSDGAVVPMGSVLNISATADSGYKLSYWSGSLSGSDNPLTYTVDSDAVTVSASFAKSSGTGGGGGGGGSATASYAVTFDSLGGTTVARQSVQKNNLAKEPTAPTKDGNTFGGWFVDEACTESYSFDTKVTKNITLYAKWTKNSTGSNPAEWINPFIDVDEEDWFFEAVKDVYQKGLMIGTSSNTFEPYTDVSRAMFITTIYRMENQPQVDDLQSFSDIKADSYYAKAVAWGQRNGIVLGISETEYAPNMTITREQMAAIVYRYAVFKEQGPEGDWAINMDYTDLDEISDYAGEAVMFCTMTGIMNGRENKHFAPKANTTRAEIATVVGRISEKINK